MDISVSVVDCLSLWCEADNCEASSRVLIDDGVKGELTSLCLRHAKILRLELGKALAQIEEKIDD